MKHLRRRIIIREYDFCRIQSSARQLYDDVNFEPVTLKEIEQEHFFKILSGKYQEPKIRNTIFEYDHPRNFLYEMSDYLYDKKYVDWFSKFDQDGYMYIQSKRNAPESMLGWATFEYDY
jgi:hypothetical protein